MAGRVLREQTSNKAIILGSYFQSVNLIHQVECAPLFSCKCAYFKQGWTWQLPCRRLNDPAQMSPQLGRSSAPKAKWAPRPTRVPTDLSPLFLYRALILILLVLLFVFSTKPCHLGTLVSQCDRERGLCPRVREQGSNSWLQIINHDLGCTLLIKCFRSVPHFKRSKDLSNRVMTNKWTDGHKALSIMPGSYEDSGTH